MFRKLASFAMCLAIVGCGGLTGSSASKIGLPSGTILVADAGNGRIVTMDDMSGAGWRTFGFGGNGVGMLNPFDVEIGPDGKIYIADGMNQRIVRIDDMNGNGWITVPSIDPVTGQPGSVTMIEISSQGEIFYASGNHLVRIDDMTGANLTSFDVDPGSGNFGLRDFELDQDEKLIVMSSRSVRRFNDISGANMVEFDHPYTSIPSNPSFQQLTIDAQNRLVISDDERIFRFDDMTGAVWIETQFLANFEIYAADDGQIFSSAGGGILSRDNFMSTAERRIGSIGSSKYQFRGDIGVTIAP